MRERAIAYRQRRTRDLPDACDNWHAAMLTRDVVTVAGKLVADTGQRVGPPIGGRLDLRQTIAVCDDDPRPVR